MPAAFIDWLECLNSAMDKKNMNARVEPAQWHRPSFGKQKAYMENRRERYITLLYITSPYWQSSFSLSLISLLAFKFSLNSDSFDIPHFRNFHLRLKHRFMLLFTESKFNSGTKKNEEFMSTDKLANCQQTNNKSTFERRTEALDTSSSS